MLRMTCKEETLTSYKEMFNYFLETYATDEVITETNTDIIMHFKQTQENTTT